MKKIILPILLFITLYTTAQVGIGTKIPEPSAMLEVKSNNKGVLISRMTESERSAIKSPASGLLVYQTDGSAGFYYHTGSEWKYLPPATIASAAQPINSLTTTTTTSSVASVAGTTNRITSSGGTAPVIDIASTYPGQSSITTLGTIGAGTWNGTVISNAKGGAGSVNGLLKANGSGTVSAAVSGTDYLKPNAAITAGTKIKLTYNAQGLVTGGSDASTNDIAEGNNKYYTDSRSRAALSLTTLGTSGAATYNKTTGVLNIPQYSGGSGGTTYSFASPLALNTGTVSIPQATSVTSGYLTSTDWNTFNNKLSTSTAASTYATIATVNGKVTSNNAITGATKTKITYDSKGLVTSGADATTTDIAEGTNLYFTEQRVRNTPLTGYTVGTNTAVSNTDNVMASIAKLQGQINAKQSSGQAWLLGGNTGTDPSTQFIGTTDNNDLVFKVNNIQAGRINSSLSNTSFGLNSLNPNTTGSGNIAVGVSTLNFNSTGSNNTALGLSALNQNTEGAYNNALGSNTLAANTIGTNNIAIGTNALQDNTSGSYNIAIGLNALKSNNGPGSNAEGNVAIGLNSMMSATSTRGNTALGYGSLSTMTVGGDNTALGENALGLLPLGYSNTAIGSAAMLRAGSDVSKSVAIGVRAGENISSSFNTYIGFESGAGNLGGGNVFLGSLSGYDEVFKNENNRLVIQNSHSPNPLLYGEFDNKNLSVNGSTLVNGNTPNSLRTAEPSAALEVKSTTQGLLLPRMTAAQRDNILNPAQGLVVYCTNCGTKGQINVYDGTEWTDMNGDATKADVNLTNGLVAYYPFTGNAGDSSGNGNHGIVNGATLTTDRFGNVNRAYSFDGINSYINVPNKSNLNLSSDEFSISIWIKNAPGQITDRLILTKSNGPGTQNKWLLLSCPGCGNHSGITFATVPAIASSGDNWIFSNTYNTSDTTQWTHCTITKDINNLNIYLNGNLVKSEPTNLNISTTNTDLRIGGDEINGGGYWFKGYLDDIRIYNRALTQSEISLLASDTLNTNSGLPVLTTTSISDTTAISATSGGNISSAGGSSITARGIVWGTSSNPTISLSTKTTDGTGTGNFASQITGLTANTTYYVRAYATNTAGTAYGNEVSFTTNTINLTNGLVAYYPFTGNAGDSSGNGNHGTVNGATLTTDRFGNDNKAYSFSSCNEVHANVNTTSITKEMTLAFWYYRNDVGCIGPRVMEFSQGSQAHGQLIIEENYPTGIRLSENTTGGTTDWRYFSTLENKKWAYYVYTNDGSQQKLYQNGILINSYASPGYSVLDGNVAFGRMNHPAYDGVNGKLDDIRIYNRALNQSEISLLASDTLSTSSSLPVLTTTAISDTTATSASSGGNITSAGGTSISARGIVWGTSSNPTISLSTKTTDGTGTGNYSSQITGLTANTTYYVRAYATNTAGTSYGNELSFTTNSINLTNGLVAYYPFTGNAGDSSGNGNHGTVYGASLTRGKQGISNSAYSFNGIDNRIDLPNPFLLGTQNSVFSFSTRVKFNDFSNVPNIWGKNLFWGEVNFQINPDSLVHFYWANSFSGNKYSSIITNPGVVHTNVWHDLVVVFQNSQGTIYIDGNPVVTNSSWSAQGGGLLSSTQTETVCNFAQDANSSRFGTRTVSGSLQGYLNGAIDDLRVYNRVLTQSEITYLATH